MDETAKLLACHRGKTPIVDVRDRAVLTLMLGCGLRRAEVCVLKLEDLDKEGKSISLVGNEPSSCRMRHSNG